MKKPAGGIGGPGYGFMLRFYSAISTNGPAHRRVAMMVMGAMGMRQHGN
ncbi:MAG: hypothetical protein ACKOA7_06470 [Bacteroidota bacterium]